MITGVRIMVGKNHKNRLTVSIFSSLGAANTVKAVIVAIEQPIIHILPFLPFILK